MYARIPIDVLKTLEQNGHINAQRLKQLRVRISSQHKRETLTLTISDRGQHATHPMRQRMVRWYRMAPTRTSFSMTESMINNLHALGVIDKQQILRDYDVQIKNWESDENTLWFPVPIWYLTFMGKTA